MVATGRGFGGWGALWVMRFGFMGETYPGGMGWA